MITRKDLQEAIAECQGTRDPDASTCIKLAAFYTIMDHMYPEEGTEIVPGHSHGPDYEGYDSGTEFSDAIKGLPSQAVYPLIDELLETLKILNPRLYDGFIRKASTM